MTCLLCGTSETYKWHPVGGPFCHSCYNNKIYKIKNPDAWKRHRQTWVSKWRKQNSEKRREKAKALYRRNIEYYREKQRRYAKKRADTDLNFRLRRALRVRVHDILKGRQKAGSAVRDLGCTWEELRSYLESLFQPGMTWDNWGIHGWHIDHKIPLTAFDLTDPEQFKKAVHYTNLQPLWANDNRSKGNKVET